MPAERRPSARAVAIAAAADKSRRSRAIAFNCIAAAVLVAMLAGFAAGPF
ncbi:MAG: hypothetical protein QHC90_27925 [Shinella sp.]|nr:hypothetical protein [Shinella sp.]